VAVLAGLTLAIAGSASTATASLKGGLALTPYMGVDTWYSVGPNVDEAVVTTMADAMVTQGLVAGGYNILWIDGGWWDGGRDASGAISPLAARWPHGMAWVVSYLHARGIHAGIYTDAGANGCADSGAGSYGHYQQDMNTFAAWGFDAVKVDFCGGRQLRLDPRIAYRQIDDAIQADSPRRPMLLNICDGNVADRDGPGVPAYEQSAYGAYAFDPDAASWRTAPDVGRPGSVTFDGVLRNLDWDALHPFAAKPGHWNDPDYIVPDEGMTAGQAQAQFSLWTIVAAPLVLGDDPRTMPATTRTMVLNPEAIAIDQDRAGIQGWLIERRRTVDVWMKPLADGSRAIALLNRGNAPASISVPISKLAIQSVSRYRVRDVWAHTESTVHGVVGRSIPPDSAYLLRVWPIAKH
jgi:alpha-galactosidase